MLEMMKSPPPGFEKIVASHFHLQKDVILKQVEVSAASASNCDLERLALAAVQDWAKTNSGVKSLISQLKTELEKQKLPASE